MRVRAYWLGVIQADVWRERDAEHQVSRGLARWGTRSEVAPNDPDAALAPEEWVLILLRTAAEVAASGPAGAAAVRRGLAAAARPNRMRDRLAATGDLVPLPPEVRRYIRPASRCRAARRGGRAGQGAAGQGGWRDFMRGADG